ncbi:hypothetical protein ACIGW0_24335 [Streptomyces bikiniensis]|uniref:Uncharacterized protein n=1 Tax=Streptomyces bikiniensis TaxID=1896 RepID=A0ABW8CY16_STRBI
MLDPGAAALLVGGAGVADTVVVSVLERRQEIGLRRSLNSAPAASWTGRGARSTR